jgi:hypothetical protein
MTSPEDDQREAAERDVRERVEYQADQVGGWASPTPFHYGDDATPKWAVALIRQFEDARAAGIRVCPHLQQAPTQPSLWLANLPDLLACQGRECEQRLVPTLEKRRGHSLAEEPSHCSVCGRQAPVMGVSVGVQTTMIRGMICEDCLGASLTDLPAP